MGDTELLEQLRAQVQSLRSPRSQQRAESGSNNSGESGGRQGPRPPLQTVSSLGIRPRPSSRLAHQDSESPIVLDVGGIQYATSVGTLTSVEYSYFALMLNGVWEPSRTEEGHIFVDRNGKMFEYILEYLRDQNQKYQGEFQLPPDEKTLHALLREAEFYQLPSLVGRVKKALDSLTVPTSSMDALVVNDQTKALKDHAENDSYEKDSFVRDRYAHDSDLRTRAALRNEDFGTDFDMVYDIVTNYSPTFSEERIQELVSKVNFTLSPKFDDGYRVKDVSSGLVLDHTQQPPYSMYLQVILTRPRIPGQSKSHHADKFVPINPSSSTALVAGGPGRPHPSGMAYLSDYHCANSGRSTQDAVDMCSSEGDMRYQDSKTYSPRQHHRIPKPPHMMVPDHSYSASGPLGSPILPNGPDAKFSLVPQGFVDRSHAANSCGQQQCDCRDYEPKAHYDHHGNKRFIGDGHRISPREHYSHGNGQRPSPMEHQRENPTRKVLCTNVPLLNLSMIGGMQGKGDSQTGLDKKGRPSSKQDFVKRVNGWGNNHPHRMGGIGTRITSPHPEFD